MIFFCLSKYTSRVITINYCFSNSSSSEEGEVDEEIEDSSNTGNNVITGVNASNEIDVDSEDAEPTMWLGTEDGCIHVYNCSDNIRIKKNKVKIQHGSPVHSIM